MAFCGKCGTQVEDGKGFCPSCGAQVGAPAQQAAPTQQNASEQTSFSAEKIEETFKNLNNTPDTTSEFDAADIEANKVMAILAYIGILVLIPLLAAPNSKFAKYHTNQGFILFLIGIATAIVGFIPILGAIIGAIVGLCTLVLAVIGIINAANGKAKELPIIGKYTLLK